MFAVSIAVALALCLCCNSPPVFAQQSFKVAFLFPEPENGSPFWKSLIAVMQAAADDFHIDLQIHYSKSNSYRMTRDGAEILNQTNRPDYFVTGFWPGSTERNLALAESLRIETLVINTPLTKDIEKEVGLPRQRFKHWIGYITPSDMQAGYTLADLLVRQARKNGVIGPLQIAGLGGFGDTSVDQLRLAGLKKRIEQDADIRLVDFLLSQWDRGTAYRLTDKLLGEWPNLNLVWTASDQMALGAIDAARHARREPGKQVIIGGFDWETDAMRAVAHGEMTATMGGHYMQGAWAMVLLYDYHNGRDFVDEQPLLAQMPMEAITADNINDYQTRLDNFDWSSVDFTRFSKVMNPGVRQYNFSIANTIGKQ